MDDQIWNTDVEHKQSQLENEDKVDISDQAIQDVNVIYRRNIARVCLILSVLATLSGLCLVIIVIQFHIVPNRYQHGVVYTSCHIQTSSKEYLNKSGKLIYNTTVSDTFMVPVIYKDYLRTFQRGWIYINTSSDNHNHISNVSLMS